MRHAYDILRQALETARGWRYIPYNPAAEVERPKVKRTPKEALTSEQVRALLRVVKGYRLENAYYVAAILGLRLGEILGLRWSDLDWEKRTTRISQQIGYHTNQPVDPKSEASRQTLPVPPRLLERFRDQWARLQLARQATDVWQEHGLIFPSEVGTPKQPSNFEKEWHGYADTRSKKHRAGLRERAGLPEHTTIHDLRRYVATMLEDLGFGQATIGKILGHGKKNVTERYIEAREQTMRTALEAVEQELWRKQDAEKLGS